MLPSLACQLSKLAYVAFEDSSDSYRLLKRELGVLRCRLLNTYNVKGTQAFLVSRGDTLLLAVRGTERNKRDILTDLRMRFYKGTHKGFLRAWQKIEQLVAEDVAYYKKSVSVPLGSCRVICTGHSLGGAISIIAGESLKADCVITFGCPRVHASEVSLKTPVIRYENGWDIVTKVPFKLIGYKHVGEKRKVGGGGWPRPFSDHRIAEYEQNLKPRGLNETT